MVDVVNRGGDAHTTGAITGSPGSALGGSDALPSRWLLVFNPAERQSGVARVPWLIAGAS